MTVLLKYFFYSFKIHLSSFKRSTKDKMNSKLEAKKVACPLSCFCATGTRQRPSSIKWGVFYCVRKCQSALQLSFKVGNILKQYCNCKCLLIYLHNITIIVKPQLGYHYPKKLVHSCKYQNGSLAFYNNASRVRKLFKNPSIKVKVNNVFQGKTL